jgi:DHA1 family inner membrane transport protein
MSATTTPEDRTQVLLITLVWLAGLGAAAQFGKIALVLPEICAIYPMSDVALGFLISCVGMVGLIFGVVGGILIGSFGIRRAFVFGMLMAGCLSLVQSLSPPFFVMLALRIIDGGSHLAIVISGPILMARHSSAAARPAVMTLWSSFFGISFVLVALIAPRIVAGFGVPGLLASHGGYMLVIGLLLWAVLPVPSQPAKVAGSVTQLTLRAVAQLHVSIYRSPVKSAAALGFVWYTGLYISLLTFLPGFVDEARRVGLSASLPLASIVTSLTLGIVLLRFVAPVRACQIGYAVTALAAIPVWILAGQESAYVVACLILLGATGFAPGASFAALADLNPKEEDRAHATGAIAQMGNVGTTCGPPVLAAIIGVAGIAGVALFAIGLSLAGIAVHWAVERRRNRM